MTEQALSLSTFYGGWGAYQRNLAEVIAPLSPEQLALRATPHHWPVGVIAQHVIANRVWWFQGWMGEGKTDLTEIVHWDPQYDEEQPPREAAELVAGLETTWQLIAGALAHWTPSDLGQVFPPAAFLSDEEKQIFGERTRQWMIWHVLEHEIHHGGELSSVLGAHELPGIYGSM